MSRRVVLSAPLKEIAIGNDAFDGASALGRGGLYFSESVETFDVPFTSNRIECASYGTLYESGLYELEPERFFRVAQMIAR